MSARSISLVVVAMFAVALPQACKRDNPATCSTDPECAPFRCDQTRYVCETGDGGSSGDGADTSQGDADAQAADAQDGPAGCQGNGECPGAVCDTSSHTCVQCLIAGDCKTGTAPVCAPNHTCVQCIDNTTCSGTAPICQTSTSTCRGCKSDSECAGGPKVCLEDGHCATVGETVYVQSQDRTPACPDSGANGTAARPYCTVEDGVAHLSGKSLLVLRGPVGGLLTLAGPSVSIVGQTNASKVATISSGAFTGITVNGGAVTVRGVRVLGGIGTGGRGVVVSGASTKLTMVNVTVTGNDGIGVEANTGAELVMSRCTVSGNAGGGVHNNAAKTTITNSVLDNNGYGIKFEAPVATSTTFNTITGNTGYAISCPSAQAQAVLGSIVNGFNDGCILDHCSQTATTFDTARPYHLTAHLSCGDFATTVLDDIDGDARTSPYDCGADQYVP